MGLTQCANVSPSTSARAVAKPVTPAGSFTASSTASNLMARCHPTRPLEEATTLSTPSSRRLSLARRTQPITTLVVTTPSARRLSTLLLTVSVSSPTNVPVSRASWSSTPLEEVPALALVPCSLSVFLSTTARSPSSDSVSTHPHRCPPPLSSHTTPCSPPTPSSSTPMSLSCLTTRPSTTSAVAAWTSSAQPCAIPTYSFHGFILLASHLCREGLPRVPFCCRDHQLVLRASQHDDQVRSSPR